MQQDKHACVECGLSADQVEKLKELAVIAGFELYGWGKFDNYRIFSQNSEGGANILVFSIIDRGRDSYILETYKGLPLLLQVDWERILNECGIKIEI